MKDFRFNVFLLATIAITVCTGMSVLLATGPRTEATILAAMFAAIAVFLAMLTFYELIESL